MMRATITVLALAAVVVAGCKTGASDTPNPEPTADSSAEQASEPTEATEPSSQGERAGSHSERMQVTLAEDPTVTGPGALSPMAIANVAEKRQQRTATCFESFEGDIEEPSRQVMLTLTLSRDGAVLEVQSSEQDELGECVAAEVKRWDFPRPEGGEVESTIRLQYQKADDADDGGVE